MAAAIGDHFYDLLAQLVRQGVQLAQVQLFQVRGFVYLLDQHLSFLLRCYFVRFTMASTSSRKNAARAP